MDTTHRAAAAIIRAHQRRHLTPVCRCSPNPHSTGDDAILWSPDHVTTQLDNAGLLAHDLPLDLDALSHPRSTLTP